MIDYENKALELIKLLYSDSEIKITNGSDSKLQNLFEHCVRFGCVLVIEKMKLNQIKGIIDNFVNQNFSYRKDIIMIRIGRNLVEFNNNFRLFLIERDISCILDENETQNVIIFFINI